MEKGNIMKERISLYKEYPVYYVQYSDGSKSVSIQTLSKAMAWKIYYEDKHPDEKVSILDQDGYIVSSKDMLNAFL
jgi:hypothetical protein